MPDLSSLSWPVIAIAAGVLLLLWNWGGGVWSWFSKRAPLPQDLGPHELFARFYDVRQWCEFAGQTDAITALDTAVLPAIVRNNKAAKT